MIQFTRLLAVDFGPFQHLEMDLAARGLLLIRGDNNDSAAADSNGSGKSHVFKAIAWCLWGDTIEGDKFDEVIRHGVKATAVSVGWHDETGDWSATRAKSRGSATQLVLRHGDDDVSGQTIVTTQQELSRRLGIDWNTWRNTVLYGQGDLARFADPKTTDAERKAVLKRILRLDVLDKAQELAKSQLRTVDAARGKLESIQLQAEAELRGLSDTAMIRTQCQVLADEAAVHEKRAAKVPQIKKLINAVDEQLAEYSITRSDIASRQVEIAEQTRLLQSISMESRQISHHCKELADRRTALLAGACPTCGAPSASMHVKKRVAELDAKIDEYVAEDDQLMSRAKAAEQLCASARELASEGREKLVGEQHWQEKSAELRASLKQAGTSSWAAVQARKRWSALNKQLKEADAQRAAVQQKLIDAETELVALDGERSVLDFWAKGFGNAGLASYLLDAIIPELTERANHYLEILADGDIIVSFDTQTQLKKGEAREKLSLSWTVEGIANVTPSGGQRKKISIAVDLALMDLVASRERASIDLLMLDEVFDGLDATGKSRVMDLLAELRQKRSTIMVISHDPGLAENFESVVTVVKTGHVAKLEAVI